MTSALDIDHADFDWLRAYLQREESRTKLLGAENAENDVGDDTSESGSIDDEGRQSHGAKRQKFVTPLKPSNLAALAPLTLPDPVRSLSGNLTNRTLSGSLAEDMLDAGEEVGQDGRRRKVGLFSPHPPARPLSFLRARLRHPAYLTDVQVGWTSTEDLAILAIFRRLGTQWPVIAAQLPGRTPDAVRNRWHRLQKTHALGDTEEGRAALDALLLACGISKDWSPPTDPRQPPTVASNACIKGSDHGRAMWTSQEDTLIEEGVRRFGCKWRQIAASLPGRSDSSVRNRWMRLQREKASARGVDELVSTPAVSHAAEQAQFAAVPSLTPVPEASEQPAAAVPAVPVLAAPAAPPAPPSVLPTAPRATTPQAAAAAPVDGSNAPPVGRPAPLPSLKRMHSSRPDALPSAKLSPLGFGSPMLGFDLMSFVEAVSGAMDEDAATPSGGRYAWPSEASSQEAKLDDEIFFEVSETPQLRTSVSERASLSSEVSQRASLTARRVPGGLGLLSAVLSGLAVLTICSSIKAGMTRLR